MSGNSQPTDFGRGKAGDLPTYGQKFQSLIRLCGEQRADESGQKPITLVAAPWVLGDTYDEIMESLSRLGEAGIPVVCCTPNRLTIDGVCRKVRRLEKGELSGNRCQYTDLCSHPAEYKVVFVDREVLWCRSCLSLAADGGLAG